MVNFLIFGFFQTVILCVYHSVAGAQRIDVFLRLLSHPALQNWLSLVPEILCCLSEKMCRGIKEIADANHCLPIHMATHKHVYALSHTYTNLIDQELFFLSSTQGNKFSLLSICPSLETGASDGFALFFHFKAHCLFISSHCFH